MNKCPHCGVSLAPQITHCPVCGRYIREPIDPVPTSYAIPKRRFKASNLVANFDHAMWLAVLVCVAVNLFLDFGNWTREAMWCLWVVVTGFVTHVCLFRPLRLKVFYWLEAVLQILFVIVYPIFGDWMTDGSVSWSVTWVLPLALCVLVGAVCIWLSVRRRDPGNLLLVSMSLFLASTILWLMGIFWLKYALPNYTVVPAFAAFLSSVSVFVFFALFKRKYFVHALKKRFHV